MQRGNAVKSRLLRNSLIGLACVVCSGCATVTGPVQVEALPDAKGGGREVPATTAQAVSEKKIGDALDQMKRLVDATEPGLLGAKSQVVGHHNFLAGTPLRQLFVENGFFVRFDPASLGQRPTEAPLFIGTVGDLISYLEDVLGLYVRMEDVGTFVVSECKEIAYDAPADAADFFRPGDLVHIMSHPDARISYFRVGKLYVYDDRTGHRRITEYVDAVSKAIHQTKELHAAGTPRTISWSSSRVQDKILQRLEGIEKQLAVLRVRLDEKALDTQLADLRARVVALERQRAVAVPSLSSRNESPQPVVPIKKQMETAVAHKIQKDSLTPPEAPKTEESGTSRTIIVYAGSFRDESAAQKHQTYLVKRLGMEPKIYRDSKGWYAVYYKVNSVSASRDLMARLKAIGVDSFMRFENGKEA